MKVSELFLQSKFNNFLFLLSDEERQETEEVLIHLMSLMDFKSPGASLKTKICFFFFCYIRLELGGLYNDKFGCLLIKLL